MKRELRTPREMEIARASVHARAENVDYGVCPLCKAEMTHSSANGIPVLKCINDRIVMPERNQIG